jgi:glucokinase
VPGWRSGDRKVTTMAVLAIDIGGTKLAAALVAADGRVLVRREQPTPAVPPGHGREVTAALLALVDTVLGDRAAGGTPGRAAHVDGSGAAGDRGLAAVGLACAGPIDVTAGTVSPVNIPAWRGEPLVAAVTAHLGGRPVVLVNDAVAMTVGEQWRGAARRVDAVLGVVVSTGVGGGIIVGGQPILGATGNAGHVGHTIVVVDGEPCPCGSRGCVETRGSAPAMVREALAHGWDPAPYQGTGAEQRSDGDGAAAPAPIADGRALAAAASGGDPIAAAAIDRGAAALAAGFVSAAALLDLDLIVVGGGFAASGETLFAPLRRHVAALSGMAFLHRLRVVPAELGRDAGLIGAARLALLA